jgi:glycyl-tRNA synthetase beta subunit
MKTLLLEIGTEELPISIFPDILAQMEKVMAESLMTFSLTYKAIKAMATPRRLTVFVKGLPERQAEKQKQIIGPPYKIAFNAEGKPTKATIGFTQRQGVSFSALRCIETPKGQYVGVKIKQRGEPIEVVLTKFLSLCVGLKGKFVLLVLFIGFWRYWMKS